MQHRIDEQIVGVPVLHVIEAVLAVTLIIPQVRIPERAVEHIVGVPFPKPSKSCIPERIQQRAVEEKVEVAVPQNQGQIMEVIAQEWVLEGIVEQSSVPRIQEQIDEVAIMERVWECLVRQIEVVPVPQITEEMREMTKSVPQERILEHTVEEIINVTVSQVIWRKSPKS